jgi:hypothetical protein
MACPHCGSTIEEGAQFCPVCGRRLSSAGQETRVITQSPPPVVPPPPSAPPTYQAPSSNAPSQASYSVLPIKPGKLQALAILNLVDGILNVLWGIGLVFTICAAPLGIYAIVLGVMEIMRATKILPDPVREVNTSRTLPIMQIVNIITGNVLSLVTGILTLVFNDDPQVQDYYRAVQAGVPMEVRS